MLFLKVITLVLASIFFGAAFYISVAEQPARLVLEPSSLLQQWKPSYRRGFAMQSSLALISALLGFAIYIFEGQMAWFLGACFMLANWPYTIIFLMPLNKELLGQPLNSADEITRQKIIKWEKLHRIRVGFSFIAMFFFGAALFKTIS